MNYPQSRKINVAVADRRKHDLSHYHVGTIDFGYMKPIECRYMVPGDEFKINILNETRVLNAMPSPTIGEFDVIYRQFFVPINSVWSPFFDFLKNQPYAVAGETMLVNSAPYISLFDLINYVINIDLGYVQVSSSSTEGSYDFMLHQTRPSVSDIYYKWTKKGRIMVNFLTSLGINIPWGTNISDATNNVNLYIVLPLTCFWKFYYDWIVPSRFVRKHQYYIQKFIKILESNPNQPKVNIGTFFDYLLNEPLCYYLDDIFTSSTLYPFQSDETLNASINIPNQSSGGDVVASRQPSDESNGVYTYGSPFNMYTLETLGKLQDMLNRQLLVGSKVQDWLLSEFGIRPNDDALHLSTYLGSKRTGLAVQDVISNADTLSANGETGTPLGAYAGYVRNNNELSFGYKAKEHGFYFITYELVPKTSYYQGLQAQFDLGDRFDFFQPEFDNQQGEPIPFKRLFFAHNNGIRQTLQRYNQPFGHGLQYSDLKVATDVLSGDFRTRFGLQLKSWFLSRDMSYISEPNNQINGIDEEFCLVKSKYQDWHYIFSDRTDELDPFLVAFKIRINALRPMKSITEGFEPTYKNSGKDINLPMQGAVK